MTFVPEISKKISFFLTAIFGHLTSLMKKSNAFLWSAQSYLQSEMFLSNSVDVMKNLQMGITWDDKEDLVSHWEHSRGIEVSTNPAYLRFFYYKNSWILTVWPCFHHFSLGLPQSLRKMQNFNFQIKFYWSNHFLCRISK